MSQRKSKYVNYDEGGIDLNDLSLRDNHIRQALKNQSSNNNDTTDQDEDIDSYPSETELNSLTSSAPYRRPNRKPLPIKSIFIISWNSIWYMWFSFFIQIWIPR